MKTTKKGEKNLKFRDGKWYLDFTFQGKRIRAFGGFTKGQARNTLTKLQMEKLNEKLGLAKPDKKPDVLFETFADEFIEVYAKQNKRSWKRDEWSLKNLKPFFKGKALQSINSALVENYRAKRKAKVSKATVNREVALLKTIFNKAVEWGKIEENPITRVKKFKENPRDMRILKDEEAIKLIDAANPCLKLVLIIALNTGMRRTEILSLRWENLSFRKGLIFVKDSKSGDREVPMNAMVYEALKELPQVNDYIFYNPKTKTRIKDVKNSFKAVCEDAGIKGLRFHDLRHTAATKMIQSGVDLVTVSRILGHSSIQMTMRYVHSTTEIMREAVEKLAKIYEKTRQKVDSPTEEVIYKRPASHRYIDN